MICYLLLLSGLLSRQNDGVCRTLNSPSAIAAKTGEAVQITARCTFHVRSWHVRRRSLYFPESSSLDQRVSIEAVRL